MDEIDIHNAKRNLKRILVRVKSSNVSEKNKNLIMGFYDDCVLSGLSKRNVLHELYHHIVEAKGLEMSSTEEEKQACLYSYNLMRKARG